MMLIANIKILLIEDQCNFPVRSKSSNSYEPLKQFELFYNTSQYFYANPGLIYQKEIKLCPWRKWSRRALPVSVLY